MAVPAGTIVEHFDVVEDISACQVTCFIDTLLDPLLFQAAEEGLSDCIDAPMSSRYCSVAQVSQDKRIQFSYNVTFQTTVDLFS